MKYIELNKGRRAAVDDFNYEMLQKYTWYIVTKGTVSYAATSIFDNTKKSKVRRLYMHRLVLQAAKIDHKNGDGLDNRLSNLRPTTTSQNAINAKFNTKNTSGYKGVCKSPTIGKWIAQIKVNYKVHYLGTFADIKEAAKAYNIAALEHFGEFAKLNVIKD